MKITLIHGQQHKGSTYHIARQVAESLGEAQAVYEFFLPAGGPDFCVGCYRCFYEGEQHCPHAAKVQPIVAAMKESDVIILSSPSYCLEMSGQMKSLFDHLAYMWMVHRPNQRMFGKVGVTVSTASGAGAAHVTKALAKQLFWLGVPAVLRIHKSVYATDWPSVSQKVKDQLAKRSREVARRAARKAGRSKPGLRQRAVFLAMRQMHKANGWNPTDKNHWEAKGWLGKARPWQAAAHGDAVLKH